MEKLERPETPLHTNGPENDSRCQITRQKISAGTRSEPGRECCDAFIGLSKTCTKLGVALWDNLGSRLRAPRRGCHSAPGTIPSSASASFCLRIYAATLLRS